MDKRALSYGHNIEIEGLMCQGRMEMMVAYNKIFIDTNVFLCNRLKYLGENADLTG